MGMATLGRVYGSATVVLSPLVVITKVPAVVSPV